MPRGGKDMTKKASLGRSIDNRRRQERRVYGPIDGQRLGGTQVVGLHTTDILLEPKGPDASSIIHENDLDALMMSAELAHRTFVAEKERVVVLDNSAFVADQLDAPSELQLTHQAIHERLVRIPRRPAWHHGMSPEELDTQEKLSFLEWRRALVEVEKDEKVLLTPFEKNLEVWRQLWRVVERSDLLVQIVDARNPLLFYCRDLEKYCNEVRPGVPTVLLINKSDFLTQRQRTIWADYFTSENIKYIFWSATKAEQEALELAAKLSQLQLEALSQDVELLDQDQAQPANGLSSSDSDEDPRTRILNKAQLLAALRSYRKPGRADNVFTVGMTGYPNVGKSSTVNVLYGEKKAAVAATPGKTKHFQTLRLGEDMLLCDCPGLVFPSFATTRASMVCNGLLPIDQLRDVLPPANIVAQNIPRTTLELLYGIHLPYPDDDEDPNRPPTGKELLEAYAYIRGFMTAHGSPDYSRAGRIVLKDYVNGKILFCYPPPSITDHLQPSQSPFSSSSSSSSIDNSSPASTDALGVDEVNKLYHKAALDFNLEGVMSIELAQKRSVKAAEPPSTNQKPHKATYIPPQMNESSRNVESFLKEEVNYSAFMSGRTKSKRGKKALRGRGRAEKFTRVQWQHQTGV